MKRNPHNSSSQFAGDAAVSGRLSGKPARMLAFLGCMFAVLSALTLLAPTVFAADTMLWTFNPPPDADTSASTLVADRFGNLYGTSSQGGASNLGTVFVLCAPGTTAPAPCLAGHPPWQEFVLYSFQGVGVADGANPYSTLIFGGNYAGRAFTLYGTTFNGGSDFCPGGGGCGTVFQLCAPAAVGGCGGAGWIEKVLWRFTSGKDGANPYGGVIEDKANFLYGTTVYGGGACNCGTVFKLKHNAAWVFNEILPPIHRFTGPPDGAYPYAALCCNSIFAIPTLYGTTGQGGGPNSGTVFRVKNVPAYPEAVLYNFCSVPGCKDGANPYGNVIFDAGGNMYGTTAYGGIPGSCGGPGCGTVFKLAALPIPLYSFFGSPDGALPVTGLTFDSAGNLYGTTVMGGATGNGTVFALPGAAPPDILLHSFAGGFDGAGPNGGVVFDAPFPGELYGVTAFGGGPGFGIAYSVP